MRVFVLGTGRCGTVTFSKACLHITNYTSGHETKAGKIDINYADNHIEVDPHLYHYLPILLKKYPTAIYVHLQREKEACVKSLSKRTSFKHWAAFAFQKKTCIQADIKKLADIHYATVNAGIEQILFYHTLLRPENYLHLRLEKIHEKWDVFWHTIKAQGDYAKALQEFKIKYNASK
jgi:uncharacterized protein YpiB (UPF0302 family)